MIQVSRQPGHGVLDNPFFRGASLCLDNRAPQAGACFADNDDLRRGNPPFFKWFTAMMDIPLGDFNRGAVGQPSFAWKGQRIAPNICYEDLFGEELGARFIDPAQAPTVFVNFSNIGWFGNSVAIDQHLHISRMRALEFERPMVRATNTGATAIIDHRGVVTHRLAPYTRGVLTGEVQGRGLGAASGWQITPYAWWVSRWGLGPLWAVGALVLALAWVARRARGH